MLLGLTHPDSGSVSLFGKSPAQAVAAGLVGGMLQTGPLIDYLSVREVVTMVASLYPIPAALTTFCGSPARPGSPGGGPQPVRRPAPAGPVRHRAGGQPA